MARREQAYAPGLLAAASEQEGPTGPVILMPKDDHCAATFRSAPTGPICGGVADLISTRTPFTGEQRKSLGRVDHLVSV
jgi:hypothetical protein